MSLAGSLKALIETPERLEGAGPADDVLSNVLRTIRLSGSVQFCFMPTGAWQTDGSGGLTRLGGASGTVPFHIMVEGTCWMRMEGQETILAAGDMVAFPFGTPHQLGAGHGGRMITPVKDLPPKPWLTLPVLHYGRERAGVRLLCGFLRCDAMSFAPLRHALPLLFHVRTSGSSEAAWLRATIAQIVAEVDSPRAGGLSMLERLTEAAFIELLRHQILAARPDSAGWLAALADRSLGRCLARIHDEPARAWSVQALAAEAGLSRSTLAARFESVLGISPMRYVRDWRLYLARVTLGTTTRPIAAIAYEAGYSDEAAFTRAFARAYGTPPAAWRTQARKAGL